jgi:regulator of protease activity HflC (stomatin/prohibitin superfamily)
MAEATSPPSSIPARSRSGLRRAWRYVHRHSLYVYVGVLSLILVMMLLAPNIFIIVPAGHVGVLWRPFLGGTVTDRYYSEGLQIIFPWDRMVIYDTRLQKNTRMYDTISSNGLAMQVEIAVRYRLDRDSAGLMHKLVGVNYPEILVYPEIGSHARELISGYTPEQLYTETRAFIQAEILERMVTQLGSSLVSQNVRGKMLHIEDVLIRSIQLPPRVAEAIERKAEQQQIMLEYDFRIAREDKEAQRKRIEAAGVRDFQAIVADTITDEYLRLRGIDATTSLATSHNSKIIIIGGKDGLPVILNTADAPGTAPSTPDPDARASAALLSTPTGTAAASNGSAPKGAGATPAWPFAAKEIPAAEASSDKATPAPQASPPPPPAKD